MRIGRRRATPAPQATQTEFVKIAVNLPRQQQEDLQNLADKLGVTFTQALREAVVLKLFVEEKLDEGSTIFSRDKRGRVRELYFK